MIGERVGTFQQYRVYWPDQDTVSEVYATLERAIESRDRWERVREERSLPSAGPAVIQVRTITATDWYDPD